MVELHEVYGTGFWREEAGLAVAFGGYFQSAFGIADEILDGNSDVFGA